MESVNRQIVRERVSLVYDTIAGTQGDERGIKKYVKALLKSVGLKDESAGTAKDFLRDFGGKGL